MNERLLTHQPTNPRHLPVPVPRRYRYTWREEPDSYEHFFRALRQQMELGNIRPLRFDWGDYDELRPRVFTGIDWARYFDRTAYAVARPNSYGVHIITALEAEEMFKGPTPEDIAKVVKGMLEDYERHIHHRPRQQGKTAELNFRMREFIDRGFTIKNTPGKPFNIIKSIRNNLPKGPPGANDWRGRGKQGRRR
jgi:hypothetical protein